MRFLFIHKSIYLFFLLFQLALSILGQSTFPFGFTANALNLVVISIVGFNFYKFLTQKAGDGIYWAEVGISFSRMSMCVVGGINGLFIISPILDSFWLPLLECSLRSTFLNSGLKFLIYLSALAILTGLEFANLYFLKINRDKMGWNLSKLTPAPEGIN